MKPDVVEALRPVLAGFHLLVQVREYGTQAPYTKVPVVLDNLSKARAKITNSCNYNTDKTMYHSVIYEWDVDMETWSLVEYIPQDTHKDDFPWRKKAKQTSK